MAPAAGRRQQAGSVIDRWYVIQRPQWSTPLNGGNTGHQQDACDDHELAAMEPAAERREHPALAPEMTP